MNTFYLICPIGLEAAVSRELELKGLDASLVVKSAKDGGVEVDCPMLLGLALNYHLKTPTRILMRIKERKCRDFPKLFKTIGQIAWRDFLVQEKVEWRISCKNSRIIHTKRAEETCESALLKYFAAAPLSKKIKEANEKNPAQKVYLRLDQDNLTISLDTSGELLHVRGNHSDRGKASLRENYASCLLMFFSEGHKLPLKRLVDPMCGTAVFLREALDFHQPHRREDFPFHSWPAAKEVQPAQVKEQILTQNAVGLDLEPKAKERPGMTLREQDIFKPLPSHIKDEVKDSHLLCNPPYGKRIKIQGDRKKYFLSLMERIESEFSPVEYGMIVPADISLPFERKIPFNNNGIKVNFCVKKLKA